MGLGLVKVAEACWTVRQVQTWSRSWRPAGLWNDGPVGVRGPKGHINMRILHAGSEAQDKGTPEYVVYRILTFTVVFWASGSRYVRLWRDGPGCCFTQGRGKMNVSIRGTQGHIKIRILHFGSKPQNKGDSRNYDV